MQQKTIILNDIEHDSIFSLQNIFQVFVKYPLLNVNIPAYSVLPCDMHYECTLFSAHLKRLTTFKYLE